MKDELLLSFQLIHGITGLLILEYLSGYYDKIWNIRTKSGRSKQ